MAALQFGLKNWSRLDMAIHHVIVWAARAAILLFLKYTFPENIIHRMPFGGLFTEDFLINTAFSKKI